MHIYTEQLKQFSEEVRRRRIAADMTQQELADKSELDIRTVQRIEYLDRTTGDKFVPLVVLFALAKGLGLKKPYKLLEAIEIPEIEYISLGKVAKPKSKKKKT
jgi:transcriptional regulator with XRE-family HTH domain